MIASTLLFVARAWTQVAAVVLLLVAGRVLNMTEFGEFTIASAVAMLLNQFVGIGAYEYVIRSPDQRDAPSTAFWLNSVLSLAYMAVGVLIASVSGSLFRSGAVATLVFLLIPLALPAGWRNVAGAVMIRDDRIGRQGLTNMVVESLALGLGVFGLLAGWGNVALVASRYVQAGLGAILFMAAAGWRPRLVFHRAEAAAMMRLWRSLIVDRGLGYFQSYGADLLLGIFMNPAAAAVYRMGARIVALVTTIVYEPMRTINWSLLARVHARHGSIHVASERIIGCVYLLLFGPIMLLCLLGGDLAVLALGRQWYITGDIIALLCVATLLTLPVQLSEPAFGVLGAIHRLPVQRMITVSVSLLLLLLLARLGPVAAAASQVVGAALTFVVTALMQRRVIGVHPLNYVREFLVAALCAGVAVAVGSQMVRLGAGVPRTVMLVVQIGISLAVYAGLILALRRDALIALVALGDEARKPAPVAA